MQLAPHQRPGGTCDLDCAVGGVVVVDIDRGLGQRRAEVADDLADGRLLVKARHQDRHPLADLGLPFLRLPKHRLPLCYQFAPLKLG